MGVKAPGSVAVGLVVGLVLVAGGATAGLLLAPESSPEVVRPASAAVQVPVTWQPFEDSRRVSVVPVTSPAVGLVVGDSGRVTRSSCSVGGVIESGSSPVTIDDRPVVALATGLPLWRDLGPGMRGDDVRALQDELVRLGHSLTPNGVFGASTAGAVRALLRGVGVSRPAGTLPVASVLWLPAPSVTAATCDVALGGTAAAGDTVAKTAGSLSELSISALPADATAGDRVLRYAGLSAPVDADGRVSAPDFLAAVAAGPDMAAFRAAARFSESTVSLTLEYVLAVPIDVAVVAPGALYGLAGASGCVSAADGAHPVTVISSSLGQAFVTVDDGARPQAVDLVAQGGAATCR